MKLEHEPYVYGKLPPSVVEGVTVDYADGIPKEDIIKKYGIASNTISRIVEKFGITCHTKNSTVEGSDDLQATLRKMPSEGVSELMQACAIARAPIKGLKTYCPIDHAISLEKQTRTQTTMTPAEMHRARLAELDGTKGISLPKLRIQQNA